MAADRRVLQLSTRLEIGGAAAIARTLAHELPRHGWSSEVLYGYGPNGRRLNNPPIPDALTVTSPMRAASNLLSHRLVGKDVVGFNPRMRNRLVETIALCELTHIHIAHSHMVAFEALVEVLIEARRPVVWTLHDQWLVTGRCAQPRACTRWQRGCGGCPARGAYPRAILDLSGYEWKKRRALISRLAKEIPVAWVACAEWLADACNSHLPGGVKTISNSVDTEFWAAAQNLRAKAVVENEETLKKQARVLENGCNVLFVCRDLDDKAKVDIDLLNRVAGMTGVNLSVVGANGWGLVSNIKRLGPINDRARLALTLLTHDVLMFTSTVDYAPLTVLEALAVGVPVVALPSAAALELQKAHAITVAEAESALVAAFRDAVLGEYPAAEALNPERMVRDYAQLYESLTP